MNIYVDQEGLKEFLSCIYEGKKELKALGKFIKGNCQVVLLPEKKREVFEKKCNDPYWREKLFAEVNGKESAEKNDKKRGNIATLYYRLLGLEDKEDERFLELLDLWVRDAEILPYENNSEENDDNFSNFTSVVFSKDRQGVSSSVLCPNVPIEEFLEKLLIKNNPNPSRVLDSKYKKYNWKDLLGDAMPAKEVIIVDPYFLLGEGITSSRKLLEYILSNNYSGVNVIVYCDALFSIKEQDRTKYLNNIINLFNFIKDTKHKITFVTPSKDKLHDRYIITNYKFYLSGHSFSQMFNSETNESGNEAKGSTWFVANNYIDIQNKEVVKGIIERLKAIAVNAHETYERIGNATSKLLNIEDCNDVNEWKDIVEPYLNIIENVIVRKDSSGKFYWNNCSIFKNKKGYKVRTNSKVKINSIKPNIKYSQTSNYYLFCDDFEIIPGN